MRTTLLTAALLAAACSGEARQTEAPDRGTVILGQVDLSFYAVTGEVTQQILREQGYEVEVVTGDHATIYPQLGRGEVHLLAASWLPFGHADLYAEVEDSAERLTPLYEGARFYWVVPAYVPEDQVATLADLAEPDVARRMPDTIAALPEGTGTTISSQDVMDAYGLSGAYTLEPGGPEAWSASLRTALDEEAWTVVPLWTPHWWNAAYDLRELEDPGGVLPEPDTAWLVAHESLRDVVDAETLERLRDLRISRAEVTEMDRLVNAEGLTPREAARRWADGTLTAE